MIYARRECCGINISRRKTNIMNNPWDVKLKLVLQYIKKINFQFLQYQRPQTVKFLFYTFVLYIYVLVRLSCCLRLKAGLFVTSIN